MKTDGPCHKCANIVNKFLAAHAEQEKYKNKYFRSWVTKTEHQIIEPISEVKSEKTIQKRSYSEINIYLPNQDSSKTVIKCKIQELFHSEQNLTDVYHEKETKHPKKLGLEKNVNFTDLIEMFQNVSSDSDTKINKAERGTLYGNNVFHDLKLRYSSSADHIRSSIAKNLQYNDQTEQTIKEEAYSKKHQISYKNKHRAESEVSFLFPQVQQTPNKKLKRYISSPELIQNMQEKSLLRAKEKEQEKKDEFERKAKEQKEKKLIREKTSPKENEQLHNKALTQTKLIDAAPDVDKKGSSKSKPENIVKYLKHTEETKDEKESSKELEFQTRLDKNKAAEFDEENKFPPSKINEKLGKYKRTENTKEEKTLIHAEEVNISELKERKDHDKTDKRKWSENIEVKETLVGNKNKVKKLNKNENLNEKEPLKSDVKQLAYFKEGDELNKAENLKKKELPISEIKHLAKVKKMVTENEKYASKTKNPQGTDVITELPQNKEKAAKEVAGFEKKGGDIPSKEIHKLSKVKLDKVGELKEVKGHEKKRDSLYPIETGKSEKANNLEDSKPNDLKSLAKKRETLQPTETDKVAKVNNVEDSKQNDIKLSQVKLHKPSTGDIITQLIKINNDVLEKDSIKPKLPELSKVIVETTKTKEKLAEKLSSTPKPKPIDDAVDLLRKKKHEKELPMNQVKLVESNFDSLILRLIKIRPIAERSVKSHKTDAVKIKKHRFGRHPTEAEENEKSSEEFGLREEPISITRGMHHFIQKS